MLRTPWVVSHERVHVIAPESDMSRLWYIHSLISCCLIYCTLVAARLDANQARTCITVSEFDEGTSDEQRLSGSVCRYWVTKGRNLEETTARQEEEICLWPTYEEA
jgi:hypothetical protein